MRLKPNINYGLTNEEITKQIEKKLVNYSTVLPTKTIPQIITYNLFTLFNILNLGLALAIFLVGEYKNLLFLGVVICNTIISMVQEIRSKKVIDKLSIIASSKVKSLRNGSDIEIGIEEIVLDDILYLKSGNQVVVDGYIVDGEVEVDESFITGESEPIYLKKGDLIKSGSFILVGNCKIQVEHIGEDNYTSKISKDAKYVKKINSILLNSLKKIIKIISFAIIPMGIILIYNQLTIDGNNIQMAVVNSVAALIGMIPEGLVLLTSTVLAVSVIRLSKLSVLVQELYCIEMLARVDTICLDKTGTITNGQMEVVDVILLNKNYDIDKILSTFANVFKNDNATMKAICDKYSYDEYYQIISKVPFSPVYKYSSITTSDNTYILGAKEFITTKEIKEVTDFENDYRVLLLAELKDKNVVKEIGIVILKDQIRASASETLKYFKNQGVDVKIISGDNPVTVAGIATAVGLENVKYIDVSSLTSEQLEKCIDSYNVFGRVNPIQKKEMVAYLQKQGHVVAMTGDGVNDVLALKLADCSIAMAAGSDAARNVSQLVLLDSDFDSLPHIVNEGRRTVNNIERSASLFLTKTTYSFLLAFLFLFLHDSYPFIPIQLTLTSVFTIGIPSFILALEKNDDIIKGNFLNNILVKAIPTALTIFLSILIIRIFGNLLHFTDKQVSTLAVMMTGFNGLLLLYKLSYPFTKLRLGLFLFSLTGFLIGIVGFKELFSLTFLNIKMLVLLVGLISISIILYYNMVKLVEFLMKKKPNWFR